MLTFRPMVQPVQAHIKGRSKLRERLLELASASPVMAGKHDKQGWVALYAEGSVVEDPVGTPRCVKGQRPGRLGCELGRFYEAFIAPSEIRFRAHTDIVCDMKVLRHVTIDTTNRRSGLRFSVPAILLYEISEIDRDLKITKMAAHWELPRMSRQVGAFGLKGYAMMLAMNGSMLRAQGLRWVLAYMNGARQGIRGKGKQAVRDFGEATRMGSLENTWQSADVFLPGGERVSAAEFLQRGGRWEVEEVYASGWTTAAVGRVDYAGAEREAVWLVEFDPKTRQARHVRIFYE